MDKENTLEKTPAVDTFEIKKKEEIKNKKKLGQGEIALLKTELKSLKKEKLLSPELEHILNPKTDSLGKEYFTPSQAIVIVAAQKKVHNLKLLSKTLAKDAEIYSGEITYKMKEVLGGEKKLGQYLNPRAKDQESIYDKLIKEFKDDKLDEVLMSVLAQKALKRPSEDLDKDEKEFVKLMLLDDEVKLDPKDYKEISAVFKNGKKEYLDAVNSVKDLVGVRLVLPVGDEKELKQVETYLTNAITKGKINVTRVSNYHANHILPYIKHEVAKHWKQIVPGLKVVETNEVRKKNGYTTTQMNLIHKTNDGKKNMWVEFQIRTKELDYISNVEHLIYDILQKKNIGKNIPELEKYYQSIGIEKAVNEVFNDKEKEQAYFNYERAMYFWVRNNETQTDKSRIYPRPRMNEYGLGKYWNILSFDALARIDKKVHEIKEKHKHNSQPEKK